MKKKLRNYLSKIILILLTYNILFSQQYVDLVNDYIKLRYNKNTFRFRLYTTKGIPDIETDDNKSMLFSTLVGDNETTCTVLKIDGKIFVYGTEYQKVIENGIKTSDSIQSVLQYENILVTQNLSIAKGITTANPDTLKIEYKVENIDNKPHEIELKLILDTFLGNNDGAPFSIPSKGIITTDTIFYSNELPEFWYALDNVASPTICSIGIAKIKNYPLPSKMVLTNWPNLYYSKTWIPELKENRKFKSSLITGTDSACGVYWGPYKLAPAEKIAVCFLYGVYGISIKAAEMFDIATAAPKKVKQNESFIFTCDIQNKTNTLIDLVEVSLNLPEEIKVKNITEEPVNRKYEKVPPGEIIKLSWELVAGQKQDLLKKSKIVINVKGKIVSPIGNVEQKTDNVEKEVVVLPLLSLEDVNKKLQQISEEIRNVNKQVGEINIRLSKLRK